MDSCVYAGCLTHMKMIACHMLPPSVYLVFFSVVLLCDCLSVCVKGDVLLHMDNSSSVGDTVDQPRDNADRHCDSCDKLQGQVSTDD